MSDPKRTPPPAARKGPPGWLPFALVPFAIFFVARTLSAFAAIIQARLAIHYDVWFELGMVTGQVLFQWLFLRKASWKDRLDYALILVFVSTLGSVLLLPLVSREGVAELVALAWFFGVVAIMFAAHWWLVVRRGLPKYLCATWVLYRILLLLVVVKKP